MDLLEWLNSAWASPEESLRRYPSHEDKFSPHRRLITALAHELQGDPLGPKDIVVLLRAVVRAEMHSGGGGLYVPGTVSSRISASDLESASLDVPARNASGIWLRGRDWLPNWLPGGLVGHGPEDVVWQATRRRDPPEPGDPLLWRAGMKTYQSIAQREAVRTVLTAPAGSTVIVNLPTGSGKSLCATLPASLTLPDASGRLGVTPIVVPTVALALDLERRTQSWVEHATAYRPGESSAEEIRKRCREGIQGPVFLSPECLTGSLFPSLKAAARAKAIRYFVVDEAHMVTAWGDDFRPAFQQIATARQELLEESGSTPPVTILMSATLTPYNLETLHQLFGSPGPIHQVHAVRLRPEPSTWHAKAPDDGTRTMWLLDALNHLPRPVVLYTLRRADSVAWVKRLKGAGFQRVGLINGETPSDERNRLLQSWADDRLDIMVGTSAFGLGVDKPDIRAVLHACCPEDVDRYYQEVGRGGRDGRPSLAVMVWTDTDEQIAKRLSTPKFISTERGLERWQAMFREAKAVPPGALRYRVPLDARPSLRPGDIDMDSEENGLWNVRTLLLMRRAGLIALEDLGPDPAEKRLPDESRSQAQLVISHEQHLEADFWELHLGPIRDALIEKSRVGWDLLSGGLRTRECLARTFERAYTSPVHNVSVVRACGGCPACRAAGASPYSGHLVPRHEPVGPWTTGKLGDGLSRLFGKARLAAITLSTRTHHELSPELRDVLLWACREGVRNLVLPSEWLENARPHLSSIDDRTVFVHRQMPRGIVRAQPTLVFVFGSIEAQWPSIFGALPDLEAPCILVLPEGLRQPDRPDRLVQDALSSAVRLTLAQWQEAFLE